MVKVLVPIYILESSEDSAHLAAKKGLPYAFASHFASTHLFSAIEIYREEFKTTSSFKKTYTMAEANVVVADTDEEAERIHTTLIKMFYGALTGNGHPLHPPTDMTDELRTAVQHQSLKQMLKYSFVDTKESVKRQVKEFLDSTNIDEIIMVSTIYALDDRIKSTRLFAEIMNEINDEDR